MKPTTEIWIPSSVGSFAQAWMPGKSLYPLMVFTVGHLHRQPSRYGMVWYGMVWYGMVWYSAALFCPPPFLNMGWKIQLGSHMMDTTLPDDISFSENWLFPFLVFFQSGDRRIFQMLVHSYVYLMKSIKLAQYLGFSCSLCFQRKPFYLQWPKSICPNNF